MKFYPVSINFHGYRGTNQSKRSKAQEYNRVARLIEDHINDKMSKLEDNVMCEFLNFYVARDINEPLELVSRIMFTIDCGHNGATIIKGIIP